MIQLQDMLLKWELITLKLVYNRILPLHGSSKYYLIKYSNGVTNNVSLSPNSYSPGTL